MSLDVTIYDADAAVYSANITHNLGVMAEAAGIYMHLWRPEELGITKASELILPLCEGLNVLLADRPSFQQFDSPNGWGTYDNFVKFVSNYLTACSRNPYGTIRAAR